jgi:hypothetical protein
LRSRMSEGLLPQATEVRPRPFLRALLLCRKLDADEVKADLPLCVINQSKRHKDIRGSRGIASLFLSLALGGVERSNSRPGRCR